MADVLGKLFSGSFLGKRATGGNVNASWSTIYMVGERGAELFVPNRFRNILCQTIKMGGSTVVNVTYCSTELMHLDPRTASTVIN